MASNVHAPAESAATGSGAVLITLASGQFLMALDSSVMNVSIATVANDLGTTVTGIQTAITLYTLVIGREHGRTPRRSALAVLAIISLVALFFSRGVPRRQPRDDAPPEDGDEAATSPG
jgi:hypothetical protein